MRTGGKGRAHCAATDIALFELEETITIWICLIYFLEGDVHEIVAVDEVAVERLAVFEFDQLE